MPRITVLMSVFNGQSYIEESVSSVLEQDQDNFEFLIIDDASVDSTWDRLQGLAAGDGRIRVLRNEINLGLTRSLNLGLDQAKGEFLARLDVDDLWLPGKLSTQISFMEKHPEVALLGTAALRMDAQGEPLPEPGHHPTTQQAIRLKMLLTNSFFHSSVLVRLKTLRDLGLEYDPRMIYAQDYDLWSRLLEHSKGANLDLCLIKFRAYEGQLSATSWEKQQSLSDSVAWANFQRLGFEMRFTPIEVNLMRRTALPPDQLNSQDRLQQLRTLRRLFKLVGKVSGQAGQEWEDFQRRLLFYCRRQLVEWPHNLDAFKAQLAMAGLDPWGACRDVFLWLRRGLNKSKPS